MMDHATDHTTGFAVQDLGDDFGIFLRENCRLPHIGALQMPVID